MKKAGRHTPEAATRVRHDRPVNFRRALLAIFVVALALRLLHDWQIRRAPFFSVLVGDAKGYDDWALRIAAGDWIGTDVFYQAPLYPYFLGVIYALFGHSLMAVRVVQALLGSASCVFLALAGRKFFSAGVAIVAGAALAVYAPAIFFDGLIQKSVLDVFFICAALALLGSLEKRAHHTFAWLWLGVALGALSLTRENALVLIVVIAVWAVWRVRMTDGDLLTPLATFVLGLAVVLLPVAVRNYAVGGGFYLTTSQFGSNLYIGNNPKATGTYVALKEGRGTPEYERQDATEMAERASGRPLTPGEVSSYWTNQALHYIASQPVAWLKLMARKFALLWNATEAVDTESQETYAEWSLPLKALGWLTHFGLLVPLAIFGAFVAWPERRRLWLLYALTITYAASVLVFYVFARYRFPLVPLLMLFAADGLVAAPQFLRARQFPTRRFAAVVATLAAIVFTNWPMLSAAGMQAATESNLGASLEADGRLDEAIAHFQRAIALAPNDASLYANLGTALRAKGQTTDAIAAYRRALAISADDPDVHYNLANALMDEKHADEALTHFAFAAAAAPDSPDIQNNYGIALAAAGQPAKAAAAFERALALDPQSARAHKNLSDMLAILGKNDEALDHLRRAVAIEPRDAAMRYDLGTTLLEAQRFPEAEAELRRAIALDPQLAEAHNNLGMTLAYEKKTAEAIAEFEKALKLDPGAQDARKNLEALRRADQR